MRMESELRRTQELGGTSEPMLASSSNTFFQASTAFQFA